MLSAWTLASRYADYPASSVDLTVNPVRMSASAIVFRISLVHLGMSLSTGKSYTAGEAKALGCVLCTQIRVSVLKCAPHHGQYFISTWEVPPSWTNSPKRPSAKRPTRASGHAEGEECLSHDQLSWAAMDAQQGGFE
jgi:hypothetical protein